MKKTKLHLNPLAAAIAIALPASVAVPAMAQPQLEEVIVTAQKREQSLQDVPVAVSAFNAEDLANSGISDITELSKSSPNTTLEVSRGTNSTLTAFIRGIGQQDPLWGFEPGVGIYVDDVYFARPQGAVLEVFDVERIEVLRGPQGTLYGKNTIGGAVKYVTRRMEGDGNASIKGTLGSYQQRDLSVSMQMPIVEDVLYIGAAGALLNREGYGWNDTLDIENGGKDIQTGRISLEYTPSEDVFVRLSYDETNDQSQMIGPNIVWSGNANFVADTGDVHDTSGSIDNGDGSGAGSQDIDSSGGSLNIEWDASEAVTLKSITAYRKGTTSNTQIDFDGSEFATLDVYAFYKDRQFSQELQVNYSSDKFNLVGGLYYFDGNAAGAFDAPILGGTAGPENGLLLLTTGGDVQTESQSAYADITYDISDRLQVYAGLRYTSDEKTANIYNMLTGPLNNVGFGCSVNRDCPSEIFSVSTYRVDRPVPGLLFDTTDPDSHPVPEGSLNETYTDVSPRIGLNFDLNDDIMIYGGFSQGFKSGGFDMRANEAVRGVAVVEGFDPEEVDSYELGLKGEFLDRIRLNAAAFYTDYTNLQAVNPVVQGQTSPVNAVENVGEASLQGLELEATVALTEAFSLLVTAGFIDTSIDKYEILDETDPLDADGRPTLPLVDVSNDRDIQNTPEYNFQIKLSYDTDLGSAGFLNANIGISGRDDVQMFEQPSPIDQEGYELIDANVSWMSADERTTVSLSGKNLADEEYRVSGYNFAGGFQFSTGFYGAPRTVALTLGYKLF